MSFSGINQLNPLETDFDNIRVQLQAMLAQLDSWKDLLVSSTGETLLDMIAGVGAVNNYLIARSIQAAFLETAQSDIQILTIANLLGSMIRRKFPASVTVSLRRSTATDTYTNIPPFTQFIVQNNLYFFNKDPLVFPPGSSAITVNLTEGQMVPSYFQSSGLKFQLFIVGSRFSCSDTNLNVYVNNELWEPVALGLWQASGNIYFARTNPAGQVEVLFGNGYYGNIPPPGSQIQISQFLVQGARINTTNTNYTVTCSAYPEVSGQTTSGISGAANQLDVNEYRFLAPRLFAAGNRCVTRQDYDAMIRTYPGVIDVRVSGEADISPGDFRWFNNVSVILLTDPEFSLDDLNKFTSWLYQFVILGSRISPKLATPVAIRVACSINVDPLYDVDAVQQLVGQNINTLFQPRRGLVGRTIYLSDIISMILSVPGVDNVTIDSPRLNVKVLYFEYVKPYEVEVKAAYTVEHVVTGGSHPY